MRSRGTEAVVEVAGAAARGDVVVSVVRAVTVVGVMVVIVGVHGAVRVAMDVGVRRMEMLAAGPVDVAIDRAVRADVLVRLAFNRHFAGTATAGGAHSAPFLSRSRCP